MTSVPEPSAERWTARPYQRPDALLKVRQVWNWLLADEEPDWLKAKRPATEPPAPKPKRTRRPSPSKLAKWEAAWQAEQASAEAES